MVEFPLSEGRITSSEFDERFLEVSVYLWKCYDWDFSPCKEFRCIQNVKLLQNLKFCFITCFVCNLFRLQYAFVTGKLLETFIENLWKSIPCLNNLLFVKNINESSLAFKTITKIQFLWNFTLQSLSRLEP